MFAQSGCLINVAACKHDENLDLPNPLNPSNLSNLSNP